MPFAPTTWFRPTTWFFGMPLSEHNRQRPAADLPYLGAREITRFDGELANDNADGNVPNRKPARQAYGLPIMAFATGLGAASFVAFAQHLLGL
jgi:hypothetical protein